MIVFVVGPSGAGKTELIERARLEIPSDLLDLDDEENKTKEREWGDGWGSRRWARDRRRIEAAERNGSVLTIVDVGAGSLECDESRAYFREQRDRMITVIVPWQLAKARKHRRRNPADLVKTEYSAPRCEVYDAARLTVDNTADEASGGEKLVAALRAIMQAK